MGLALRLVSERTVSFNFHALWNLVFIVLAIVEIVDVALLARLTGSLCIRAAAFVNRSSTTTVAVAVTAVVARIAWVALLACLALGERREGAGAVELADALPCGCAAVVAVGGWIAGRASVTLIQRGVAAAAVVARR